MDESQAERPASSDAEGDDPVTERTSGLTLETCFRHPREVTGVHCTRCGRPICPECMTPAPVGYQCPECVKEARGSAPRRASLRIGRRASVVRILLAVNVAMFVVEVSVGAVGGLTGGSSRIVDLGALVPFLVAEGQYWRLLTAMFLHASLLHIAFNMYALYLFGNAIEDALGSYRFLAIYFACGLFASVTSFTFGDPFRAAVGASGAIFGLLGAWVAFNYRRRGTALASANLRMALLLIAINVFLGFSISGIDNYAHLGGLVSGAAAGWLVEGFGPRNIRPFVPLAGFSALAVLAIAMTAWRVAALT